jgi:hypothetical protein
VDSPNNPHLKPVLYTTNLKYFYKGSHMKRSFTAMVAALGLVVCASSAMAADAMTKTTATPGAAMDQSLNKDQAVPAEKPMHKAHAKHHRTHKPAHGSAATSEDAKTNGKKHHHRKHHAKADAAASTDAGMSK